MRLDTLNLRNRTQFYAPNTDPSSSNFGKVTSSNGIGRNFYVQARLLF
jgi:hypothetical protein